MPGSRRNPLNLARPSGYLLLPLLGLRGENILEYFFLEDLLSLLGLKRGEYLGILVIGLLKGHLGS